MDAPKEKFLRDAFFSMMVKDALGRSKTYSESASDNDKKRFRNALRKTLNIMAEDYASQVREEKHLSNIKKLSDNLSSKFNHCLRNGRFRIGIAQKALNIFLKYLWCAGLITMPPHCPFDSIVINSLPGCEDFKWTSIDSIDEYKRLVKAAKQKANGKSLSEWELEIYSGTDTRTGTVSKKSSESIVDEGVETYLKAPTDEVGRMPRKGDVFQGKINDLCNYDRYQWRRRDIWFYKSDDNRNEMYDYPTQSDWIALIDTDGNRYELNFSKPETKDKVCLGTPSRLKPWYRIKGFDYHNVARNDFVYFEYTGKGNEFFIFTIDEYRSKQKNKVKAYIPLRILPP